GLRRTDRNLRMIDKESRQIEHARHPRDDGNDMDRLGPEVKIARRQPAQDDGEGSKDRKGGEGTSDGRGFRRCSLRHGLAPLTSASICSTWAMGVSGVMPWPRLKTSGPSPRADRMEAMPSDSARRPATRRCGARLPWTAPSCCKRRAWARGTVQSRP